MPIGDRLKILKVNGIDKVLSAGNGNGLEDKLHKEIRESYRMHGIERMHMVYVKAYRKMRGELRFASAPLMYMNMIAAIYDMCYSVNRNPLLSKEYAQILTGDDDMELLSRVLDDKIRKVDITAEYCKETGVKPDRAVRKKKHQLEIIKRQFGSLDGFLAQQKLDIKAITGSPDIDKISKGLAVLITTKGVSYNEIGLEYNQFKGSIREFMEDFVKFSHAYVDILAAYENRDNAIYRSMSQ